jgi:hypothetical protein
MVAASTASFARGASAAGVTKKLMYVSVFFATCASVGRRRSAWKPERQPRGTSSSSVAGQPQS